MMSRVDVSASSVTSAPAENTVSPPVTTTALLDSTSLLRTARSNSVSMCVESALRLCSRRSVMTATPRWQRTSTVPAVLASATEGKQLLEAPLVGLVGDDQPLDLGGALPDPVDPQLAPQPLHRVVANVATAAEDLHCPVDHSIGRLRCSELDSGRLGVQRLSLVGIKRVGLIELPRHLVGVGPVRGDVDHGVGDHALDQLPVDQWLATLDARPGPIDREGKGPFGGTDGAGSDHQSLLGEPVAGQFESRADLAQHGFPSDVHVLKTEFGMLVDERVRVAGNVGDLHTRGVDIDEEHGRNVL